MVVMKVQHLKVHGEDLEDSNLQHNNLQDNIIEHNYNTIQINKNMLL
jgi:hypothetical protein